MVVYDLRETYHMAGTFDFKIVLDKSFKNGHDISVEMFDPTNQPIDVDVETWGRKINCSFSITDDMMDGVCIVKVGIKDKLSESLQYWIIK